MADRFYCPELTPNGQLVLRDDEAKHLARVARREVGEIVEIFDGKGHGWTARIDAIAKNLVELSRVEAMADRCASIEITLLVAPPKGDRFDWLVEKATEIGVVTLVPIKTTRSVVDPRTSKLDRVRRLVIEASKQCGRNRLMEIAETVNAVDAFRKASPMQRFIAHASDDTKTHPAIEARSQVTLAIGPEGGWTQEELDAALASGWKLLDLGETRLRIETAAIVGASRLISFSEQIPS